MNPRFSDLWVVLPMTLVLLTSRSTSGATGMFSWGDFFIAITIYIHSDKSLFQSEVKYRIKPVSCIAKNNVFVFTVGQLK